MNDLLKSINWRQHTISFICIFISLTVFSVSIWFFIKEKNKLSQVEMALSQQKSINDTAEQSVLQLRNYYNEYKLFKESGLIGDPPRLEWAEVLLEKYYDIKIPGLYFMLSPTGLSKPDDTFFTSDIEIKKTPMQINFNLLHEGDFYFYLRHLHQQAKGQFNVEECKILRSHMQAEESLTKSFSGECKILWFSLTDISASWPQGIEL